VSPEALLACKPFELQGTVFSTRFLPFKAIILPYLVNAIVKIPG